MYRWAKVTEKKEEQNQTKQASKQKSLTENTVLYFKFHPADPGPRGLLIQARAKPLGDPDDPKWSVMGEKWVLSTSQKKLANNLFNYLGNTS